MKVFCLLRLKTTRSNQIGKLVEGFSLYFLILLAAGCTTAPTTNYITSLEGSTAEPKVLLMPLDVELSALTAGGLTETRADWTESAIGFIKNAIDGQGKKRGFQVIAYDSDSGTQNEALSQIQKLHEVVGRTMLEQSVAPLPSKVKDFSWSLGTEATVLSEAYDADYALYLFMRDSYATAGRQALVIASALLGRSAVPEVGRQKGYASLVDLKSGDIVWFNSLNTPKSLILSGGDIREWGGANASIEVLLNKFPSNKSK